MVYLKRIETRGFKSLGSKTMSVPVERGFVSITGPNGSGKSNLLDAMIFALGENSPKTLRVPNLGALIYDGSVEEQKPSSAKVSLQFDNSDRRIPVDSDSVTISRELKNSGESIYSLNGKHIQRNNLGELLEVALITSRGLNIVLQGMITRISELVPDEKRKLIEQMVGVAQFDEKKDLAMSQLDEADRKLEVAMAKIGEIRDRVQQLERERNDQLRVRQLEDQITWLRAATISGKLVRVRQIIEQRKSSVAISDSKIEQLQARLSEVSGAIESTDQERNRLIQSAMDAGAAKVELEAQKLKNGIDSLTKERTEASLLIERLAQVIPTLEQMSSNHEIKLAQTEQQITTLQQKLLEFESSKKDLLVQQNSLNAERLEFEKQLSAVQEKLARLRISKERHDAKLQNTNDRANRLTLNQRAIEDKKSSTLERIRFFDENLGAAKKNIAKLDSLLASQKNELRDLRYSKSKVEKLGKRVQGQIEIALLILQKAQEAVRDYDSEFSAIENVAGEEMAIAKLDELGRASALDGYFGPLRSLISFEPEYAQAIAALGKDWLNAIIVRDVPALLAVTEAAKKMKIARFTAIPLSEVADIERIEKKEIPGIISFTTETIGCDNAVRNIVQFVFGDSVVVSSAKTAFLLARKGFRAVTLQGDIFEPDLLAFETGYSKKYLQISTLLSQQKSYDGIRSVLASLQKLIERRKTTISDLHNRIEAFASEENSHDRGTTIIETKLEDAKQMLGRYSDDIEALYQRLKSTENESDHLKQELAALEKRNTALRMGSQKLVSIISSFDLTKFDGHLASFNKNRTDLESRLDTITANIRETNTEIIRYRGDLENNLKPAFERLKQQKSEGARQLEERTLFLESTKPKLEELEAKLAELQQKEAETLDRAKRYQPMLDELNSRAKSLKVEEDTIRKVLSSAEREHISLGNDLAKLVDSERTLVSELSMNGYADPIETFESSDALLKELQQEFESLRNNVNFNADRNYREIFENYKYSSVRKNELEKERNAIVTFIETIDAEKKKVFMDAFERIDKELRIIFTKITGGNAWLEIEKPDSIFDSGVFLMAQFPGKLPRDSSSVSGGEKTMSALSFILAIQAVFPSPFYVFDEVDAHLDSVYSGKLAGILAERCTYSQIIIVSLKDTVVSKTTSVIGVYMDRGTSKVIRYRSGLEVELRTE